MSALTYNGQFESELRKAIDTEVERRKEYLGAGSAGEFNQYKQWVGEINGLRRVLELCDEVNAELSKR